MQCTQHWEQQLQRRDRKANTRKSTGALAAAPGGPPAPLSGMAAAGGSAAAPGAAGPALKRHLVALEDYHGEVQRCQVRERGAPGRSGRAARSRGASRHALTISQVNCDRPHEVAASRLRTRWGGEEHAAGESPAWQQAEGVPAIAQAARRSCSQRHQGAHANDSAVRLPRRGRACAEVPPGCVFTHRAQLMLLGLHTAQDIKLEPDPLLLKFMFSFR